MKLKILIASLVSVVLLALAADLWLVRRIEHRLEDQLSCRLGVEATADVAWWRGLPALVTRSVGVVRLGVPLEELGADRGLSVSGDDGRLVVGAGRLGASVVIEPRIDDGRVAMDVVGVQVGGREVGGLVADALGQRLAARDLGGLALDGLPDAVRLTGVDVADDGLVIEAEVDPDGLSAQERAGCS